MFIDKSVGQLLQELPDVDNWRCLRVEELSHIAVRKFEEMAHSVELFGDAELRKRN